MLSQKGRKTKGADFELLIAKTILQAVGEPFTKKDCYRTPLSGGHPYTGDSDLQISPRLLRRFPFVVECKHRKDWFPAVMFSPRKEEQNWLLQVSTATAKVAPRIPLLVMRGNHTKIYGAAPRSGLQPWLKRGHLASIARLVFWYEGTPWWLVEWDTVLAKLGSEKAKAVK